jgi:mRNA interferase MazF
VRGEVYRLRAPRNSREPEQRGERYAVVVQSDLLPLSTWLVAPTSTSAWPASFRPQVEIDGKTTLVLAEQTAAVDPERLGERVGVLTARKWPASTRHYVPCSTWAERGVLGLSVA